MRPPETRRPIFTLRSSIAGSTLSVRGLGPGSFYPLASPYIEFGRWNRLLSPQKHSRRYGSPAAKMPHPPKGERMTIHLEEVDRIEIHTLQDNTIDIAANDGTDVVQRASSE